MIINTYFFISKIRKNLSRLVAPIIHTGEKVFLRYFYKPKNSFSSKCINRYLIADGQALSQLSAAFKRIFPDKVQQKIIEADQICEHKFDLLGSGPTCLSTSGSGYKKIDWHTDFKSKYTWNSNIFYRDIRYGKQEGVDVKVPWELSRFQHLSILGEAYSISGNEKYRHEFVSQISDWIASNSFKYGVNWVCPMDVAIRAANWLVALEFFDASSLPEDFMSCLSGSLYQHAAFIDAHMDKSGLTTNHYVAELGGLLFIAVYCPYFPESEKWKLHCISELEREIKKQVYSDGCDYESSTSYHRLVLELFYYCELLVKRSGSSFSNEYRDRVKAMFEFSLYCIKPNGCVPQIGDNDNGRFIIFSKRESLHHAYLMSIAVNHYQESIFRQRGDAYDEEAFWLFGEQGFDVFQNTPVRTQPLASRAFEDAGWYILRHNNDYCFVICGPKTPSGVFGHAHNDKLSFDLMLDGVDVVVDPGTYVYTPYPAWRNKYRSTGFHNTAYIAGQEQSDISKNIFKMEVGIKVNSINLKEDDKAVYLFGEVVYNVHNFRFRRDITLYKTGDGLVVKDKVVGSDSVEFNLCLGEKAHLYSFNSEDRDIQKIEAYYSKGYGSHSRADWYKIVGPQGTLKIRKRV